MGRQPGQLAATGPDGGSRAMGREPGQMASAEPGLHRQQRHTGLRHDRLGGNGILGAVRDRENASAQCPGREVAPISGQLREHWLHSELKSILLLPVLKRLIAGLCVGSAIVTVALPASAGRYTSSIDNDLPIRWNTGGAVWSTSQDSIDTFLSTGSITDRGLEGGLNRSGWTSEEVRAGMNKAYAVDLVGVSRFLYSDAGVRFLKNASASYFPYYSMDTYAVQALRSAIISDAADGSISSVGIMRALPTDFRLADFCNTYTGAQNICAEGRCQAGTNQCTSLFSWYVFLPACIQANQKADPVAAVRTNPAAPMQQAPIRGLW